MLIVKRRKKQRIRIDGDIILEILEIRANEAGKAPVVTLSFDAPRSKRIECEEIYQKKQKENALCSSQQ